MMGIPSSMRTREDFDISTDNRIRLDEPVVFRVPVSRDRDQHTVVDEHPDGVVLWRDHTPGSAMLASSSRSDSSIAL